MRHTVNDTWQAATGALRCTQSSSDRGSAGAPHTHSDIMRIVHQPVSGLGNKADTNRESQRGFTFKLANHQNDRSLNRFHHQRCGSAWLIHTHSFNSHRATASDSTEPQSIAVLRLSLAQYVGRPVTVGSQGYAAALHRPSIAANHWQG